MDTKLIYFLKKQYDLDSYINQSDYKNISKILI